MLLMALYQLSSKAGALERKLLLLLAAVCCCRGLSLAVLMLLLLRCGLVRLLVTFLLVITPWCCVWMTTR
jgi:hypothetical protein